MKKSDFIAEVAKRTGVPRTKADEAVNAMIDVITDTLRSGDRLTLTGFGTFEVRERAARPGINIRTKEKITIAASKRPVFNAGAVLKNAVSNKTAEANATPAANAGKAADNDADDEADNKAASKPKATRKPAAKKK